MPEKPLRRTEARIAQRERARARQQRSAKMKTVIPLALGAVVVLFVVFVAVTTVNQTTQGTIGPRLQVDREQIDLGRRVFDQPVRAVFNIKNVGDGTLRLNTPRLVTALEGC